MDATPALKPLPTRLEPEDRRRIEAERYAEWESRGLFEPRGSGAPFTIPIPPPNVTGILHMGHALNNTLQDILIRFHRMLGERTLWVPGTDHAGIATQHVVEERLAKKGTTRKGLGRPAFLLEVWRWKEEYGGQILGQLRRLGSSCDWKHLRFTMDEGLSRAVREVFVRLHGKGLVYRGTYIVNWCPHDQTALSDDEVEMEESEGSLWHIRYPIVGEPGKFVTVATTRPETMLGDTGVAVHPEDERYARLHGQKVLLPLQRREIPVVTDAAVDKTFGTGAVKVTPGHDPADFEIGKRHGLPVVNILTPEGILNENAGKFRGLAVPAGREAVVKALEAEGLLERVETMRHSVGHCYRCHAVIEPFVSEQWFVKMKPLAQAAARATRDGLVRFYPARWEKVYLSWLDNVRDWCISRQIWWGHRIPVWYCRACPKLTVAIADPDRCAHCGSAEIRQDEDVLDTWFSSALWPFSTLGWPEKTSDLETHYPNSTLVTDRGIIYFWVARMVMMGLEFMGRPPFRDVVIHGTILDAQGRKMSKSLGNGIDPLDMIGQYGADAVRFSLADLCTEGQDVRLAPTRFEKGRNFVTKIQNGVRFALTTLSGEEPAAPGPPRLEDRWILSRCQAAAREATAALEQYRFSEAAGVLWRIFWNELCDVYLELAKPRLRDAGADRARARATLADALSAALRLLHPLLPHMTEEWWRHFRATSPGARAEGASSPDLIVAPWPRYAAEKTDAEAERVMERVLEVVTAVRNIRAKNNIPPGKPVKVVLSTTKPEDASALEAGREVLKRLAGASDVSAGIRMTKPAASATEVVGGVQVFVPIEGIIDRDSEIARLQHLLAEKESQRLAMTRTLENEDFLQKAPPAVVEQRRKALRAIGEEIEKIRRNLEDLGAKE